MPMSGYAQQSLQGVQHVFTLFVPLSVQMSVPSRANIGYVLAVEQRAVRAGESILMST